MPKGLAAGAVETQQRAAVLLLDRLREVNTITPENRRGVATFGEWDPPADVVGAAPLQRQRFFRGDPIERWTAPVGPIRGS